MATLTGPIALAPTGSTGTPTSSTLNIGAELDKVVIQFVVEAIGTTITYKAQGSVDGTNWYDLPYVLPSTDTLSQAAITRTTTGADIIFAQLANRWFTKLRSVVTANTGITFRIEAYLLDAVAN